MKDDVSLLRRAGLDTVQSLPCPEAFRSGNGEERLAMNSLYANHKEDLAIELDGTRVERGIHADAFHEIRIRVVVQVISPEDLGVPGRHNRICISLVDAISFFSVIICPQPAQVVSPDRLLSVGLTCRVFSTT